MSLIETAKIDQIEITENNIIQVRTAIIIEKDGIELTRTFHRHTCVPGQNMSDQDPKVQVIANAIWTPEVIEDYEASIVASIN